MTIRTIRTKDFFGKSANFEIIWETVCMTCTFAVGIQTNMGGNDIYTILDTGFLDVYQKYGYLVEEKVKKEMKKVIKRVLTARVKSGMITIEQIERWAKNEN